MVLTLVAVLTGLVVARGFVVPAFVLLAIAVALTLGIYNWRWSVYGLLLYLPLSGIPILLTYPTTSLAVLIKDVIFVVPAYTGFFLAARRRDMRVPGAPIAAIGALVLLLIVESFRQSLPNVLVPLIGLKVWLFYIPLIFLGYHLIESRDNLRFVLAMMTAIAMLPAAVGIIEAVAIYGGHANDVYSLYGPAAASVTQNFAQEDYLGGGFSRRIPSIFSFVTQYFTFIASMLAVSYAWWRLSRRWVLGATAFIILLVACFMTGARGAFVMAPLLVALMVYLDGRLGWGTMAILAVASTLLGAVALFGAHPAAVLAVVFQTGLADIQDTFVTYLKNGIQYAVLGLGTGYSTGPARYAFGGQADPRYIAEAWWAKVILELGLAGLLTVLIIFGQLLGRAYRVHRRMTDPGLKAVSAALIAWLVWNLIYFTKGSLIDIDPINVYFWLFAGMLLRVGSLGGEPSASARVTIRAKQAYSEAV